MIKTLIFLFIAVLLVLLVARISIPFMDRFGEWWDGKVDEWFDKCSRRRKK